MGAGPAGLTAASMLSVYEHIVPVVLEADTRIGGKSLSMRQGPLVSELGTAYLTKAHRYTDGLMKQMGFEQYRLGRQMYDGRDFVDYMKAGPGAPLGFQAVKFAVLRALFMRKAEALDADEKTRAEAARPVGEWLERHKLPKMVRFMHRSLSAMGYGYVETTPTLQALRWCDHDLILTGIANSLFLPCDGWSAFWEALAADMDVRMDTRIQHIARFPDRVEVQTDAGTETYDALINTIPPDAFMALVEPTDAETFVSSSIEWQSYSSAIIAAENWFTEWVTEGYSESATAEDRYGRLVAARVDGEDPELGGHIYITGQVPGPYSDDELKELLRNEVEKRGGRVINIILQKRWKYFPQYKRAAIEEGLVARMKRMQGEQRTWHSGAAFSHESVANVEKHNQVMIPAMVAALKQGGAPAA